MTSIDFYFNAEDRLQVACRLAGKAMKQNQPLLIYAPDAEIVNRIKALWTGPIVSNDETPQGYEVLLNLGADCPPHFERFLRLLEVVDSTSRETARNRYRYYRERGYKITNHDLARR